MNLTPCPVCTVKWGKALTVGNCVCSGHISLDFKPPGRSKFPDFTPKKQVEETKETGPKIGAKERARLQKALGKPL